jgi:hypothetical protein
MSKPLLSALDARVSVLEQKAFGHKRRRLTKRQLAELEGCSTRHIDRGVKRGVYAQPEIENKRCYWWSDSYRRKQSAADTLEARAARNPKFKSRSNPAAASPEV